MRHKLSILLVEDEPSECHAISQYIEGLDDVQLVGVTNNSQRAIELVCDALPDAVILDLELHKGGGNGLFFLQELRNMHLRVVPYILVTTNNTSNITFEQARQTGADFILTKWQGDYSAQTVVEFLRSIKSTILGKAKTEGISLDMSTTETPAQIKSRLEKRISKEMDLIGINPKAFGRKYLLEAIQMVMNQQTRGIPSAIAARNGKSEPSVERAMQNAINRAWNTANTDDLARLYTAQISSEKGVPTVTEFIFYYAEKIKTDYAYYYE